MVHCSILGDQIGSHTAVSPRDLVSKSDLASEDLAEIIVNGLRLTDIIAESTTSISGIVSVHFTLFLSLSSTTCCNDCWAISNMPLFLCSILELWLESLLIECCCDTLFFVPASLGYWSFCLLSLSTPSRHQDHCNDAFIASVLILFCFQYCRYRDRWCSKKLKILAVDHKWNAGQSLESKIPASLLQNLIHGWKQVCHAKCSKIIQGLVKDLCTFWILLLLPVFLLSPILIHATNYFCYWSFGLLAYTLVFSALYFGFQCSIPLGLDKRHSHHCHYVSNCIPEMTRPYARQSAYLFPVM